MNSKPPTQEVRKRKRTQIQRKRIKKEAEINKCETRKIKLQLIKKNPRTDLIKLTATYPTLLRKLDEVKSENIIIQK